ncbi:MAG: anti-FecI sigma factor, FecR [Segetibacter sp.]|nr:anti-FecI sigma factor, FecR [Segetibacter sp.]
MDKYKNFSVEDFLQDKFFHEWVKDPFSKDAELWERWLERNPQMLEVVDEAKNILLAFDYQPKQLPDDFYVKIKSRIDSSLSKDRHKQTKTFFIGGWLKMAAVFTGLIIAASILFYSLSGKDFITYSSKYAETKKLLLPDGSEVVLNANSFLKYKDNRNKKSREVWLKGEGFFYIKHEEDREGDPVKFIVHTQDVNVEVLGTQFNVNNNDINKTEVLLTKGKVRLSLADGGKEPVMMTPQELVLYNNKTKGLSVTKVSPGNYIAWMDHKYIFEKITLGELCKTLSRYYGKSVTIRDPAMRQQRLSGTLELQDEETLIRTLSALLGVLVNKNGNQIIIGS